ncbi:hypothetical protein EDB83DRAFT_442383 [Lactarius deliciosus]|nr:hypothetical protein EDB83DRAFT_442383 [Lactarius deliciosus]
MTDEDKEEGEEVVMDPSFGNTSDNDDLARPSGLGKDKSRRAGARHLRTIRSGTTRTAIAMMMSKVTRTRVCTRMHACFYRRSSQETHAGIVAIGHARGRADVLPPSQAQVTPTQDALYVDRGVDGTSNAATCSCDLYMKWYELASVRSAETFECPTCLSERDGRWPIRVACRGCYHRAARNPTSKSKNKNKDPGAAQVPAPTTMAET